MSDLKLKLICDVYVETQCNTFLRLVSHNVLTYGMYDCKLIAAIILFQKLASECIASASCCRESNGYSGNPTLLFIASNLYKN